ncbi:MAG: hypothetical protein DIZ80_01980 [endosymbiont of Galathealinum brachiosum]|uniref:DUF5666 domain-containing protein n=1 Tax=endosymbiont of Galathealinum brachiosum TaxID=2200906 RepID=A0A370DLC8_9GAMM|nr:MAG: hypothetical protein DIZ80_01980 [endosymbiont of Galathealinum brachiosum]
MNKKSVFNKTVLAASIAMLSACGGSSSQTSGSGTTVGVVTGFGSVYVNGVEYETDSASIDIDGLESIETSLGIGDVVILKGSVNADGVTGNATSISCTDELEGYVLDLSGLVDGVGTINIMGQSVTINIDTVFDSDTLASISELSVDDIVEVSGFADGIGSILATRIETKNDTDEDLDVELKGLISNLDTTALTFTIGDLTVDYSEALEVDAGLADGVLVEVKTQSAISGNITDGFLMSASKVEIEDDGDIDFDGDEGEDIEMQGMVSGITDTSFLFNGQLVEFDSLEIDDDFDMASLVDGMIITVEGHIAADGSFVVEEIEEDHDSDFEVEGFVTDKTDTTVTISQGDSTLTFTVNNDTRMIDEQDEGSSTPLHFFSLADVAIDEFVEIKYYVDETSEENIATELEREDAPSPEPVLN